MVNTELLTVQHSAWEPLTPYGGWAPLCTFAFVFVGEHTVCTHVFMRVCVCVRLPAEYSCRCADNLQHGHLSTGLSLGLHAHFPVTLLL
jgi:hypothetical protein